jgi:two-component system chemotaxis response regulator CheY
MRRILTNVLRSGGCEEILVAENGTQAIEACGGDTALLLTAWNLPEVDGLEVTRRLRQGQATARIKVLLLTPRNSRSDVLNAKEAGVDGYLLRPFTAEDLRASVRKLLNPEPALAEVPPVASGASDREADAPESAAA